MQSSPEGFVLTRLPTPIGTMLLVTDGAGVLRALDFEEFEPRMRRGIARQYGGSCSLRDGMAPDPIIEALRAYFSGADLKALDRIPVAANGTPFQREVWAALRDIPVGETVSYGALARRIERPAAVRAVGLANGANPIGVVVPCHRVIGSDGSLTGYGGGLERKRWLLRHEGAVTGVNEPEQRQLPLLA
jgi:methylated-DNA-[protein]-cysteine S-methyltransferase